MSLLTRLFGTSPPRYSKEEGEELDEWARHHDDPRSELGFQLFVEVSTNPDLTGEELRALWQRANSLVGKRAPADYGEFLAYGYIEGRRDALTHAASPGDREGGNVCPCAANPTATFHVTDCPDRDG